MFALEGSVASEFYVMSNKTVFKVDRDSTNPGKYSPVYTTSSAETIKDMIRIQDEGIVVVSLSSFRLITLNLLASSASERAMPLLDYMNYIDISQLNRVISIRSFFSESCILILFESHKSTDPQDDS